MPISPIQPISIPSIQETGLTNKVAGAANIENAGKAFSDVLNSLSASENQTGDLMQQLAAGENVELHDVMLSAEQTDVNFRVVMAIRDKLVDAYREVMRMSI
jgi:flagellar hook-basal body complex protein FliE